MSLWYCSTCQVFYPFTAGMHCKAGHPLSFATFREPESDLRGDPGDRPPMTDGPRDQESDSSGDGIRRKNFTVYPYGRKSHGAQTKLKVISESDEFTKSDGLWRCPITAIPRSGYWASGHHVFLHALHAVGNRQCSLAISPCTTEGLALP